jgi:hypothetical protein
MYVHCSRFQYQFEHPAASTHSLSPPRGDILSNKRPNQSAADQNTSAQWPCPYVGRSIFERKVSDDIDYSSYCKLLKLSLSQLLVRRLTSTHPLSVHRENSCRRAKSIASERRQQHCQRWSSAAAQHSASSVQKAPRVTTTPSSLFLLSKSNRVS